MSVSQDTIETPICLICKKELNEMGSAYSLCFDEKWKVNVWGGDYHEYKGYFCERCAKALIDEE